MAYDVFISHSIRNKAIADALCDRLEATGMRCWMAPRDILPGLEWGEAIIDGIKQSRIFLLVFSSHANTSKQVLREVERAASRDMVLLPVRVEDVEPSAALEYYVSTPQWLDAITPPLERHLERVVQIVGRLLERPEAAPERAAASAPRPGRRPALEAGSAARQTAGMETAPLPTAPPGERAIPETRAGSGEAGSDADKWAVHPKAPRAARIAGGFFLILGLLGATGFSDLAMAAPLVYALFGVWGMLAGHGAGSARTYHGSGAIASAIVVATGIFSFILKDRSLIAYPWMLLHAAATLGMGYFAFLHLKGAPNES